MTPENAPPIDPVDLVLHIGSGKTGTSSIQFFLRDNRERLSDLGHLYPQTPGRARHTRLGLFIKPDEELVRTPSWHRQGFDAPETFRRSFRRRLLREIGQSGRPHVLLSDEALFASSDQALRRLSRLTGRIARSLRLVVYLRRQDDHLVSRYQQMVKVGHTTRMAERTQEPDLSGTYDYYARLRTWTRLLQPDEFVVRRFEPDRFAEGSLYQDFLDAAGVDVRAADLRQAPHRNESLDAESVEFLRLLNLYRLENETAATGPVDHRRLVRRLADASSGPTLTLPSRALDEFMARWEESNRRVAREYLGDDDGQLFSGGRKTGNTTTDQRLDPGRLDHFLALAEMPERLHTPMRALAEREAKAR